MHHDMFFPQRKGKLQNLEPGNICPCVFSNIKKTVKSNFNPHTIYFAENEA